MIFAWWRDAPAAYGPHKRLYNRWKRWSDKGIFARMMAGLATAHGDEKTVMIDATYLKAHRTANSMGVKKGGRSGDKNRVCADAPGLPIRFEGAPGQRGAARRRREDFPIGWSLHEERHLFEYFSHTINRFRHIARGAERRPALSRRS